MPGLRAVKAALKGEERYRVLVEMPGPRGAAAPFIRALQTLVRRYGGKIRVRKGRARRARKARK